MVAKGIVDQQKSQLHPDIVQLPAGSQGLKEKSDGFKVITTSTPLKRPPVKWAPRKKELTFLVDDTSAVKAQDRGAWNAAVGQWQALAEEAGPEHSELATALVKTRGSVSLESRLNKMCLSSLEREEAQELLNDQCCIKSTGALNQRAGRVSMFIQWCWSMGRNPFPLTADLVYDYVKGCCKEKAQATRAVEVVKGLRLATHILELHNPTDIFMNPRIQGCIKRSYSTKRLTKKAIVFKKYGCGSRTGYVQLKVECPASFRRVPQVLHLITMQGWRCYEN